MSLARVYSRAQLGVEAPLVEVETHLGPGLPNFNIVGLPDTAVREAKDRVRSAIINSGFLFPQQRITVNLAPADLPKDGGRFDLAIAVSLLIANGQLRLQQMPQQELLGELALNGELRPVSGALPAALAAAREERELIVPLANADEAALSSGTCIYPAASLTAVCMHLNQSQPIKPYQLPKPATVFSEPTLCLSEVRGQQQARRALEISASGGHSLLLSGSPGSGKSMLAARLPGILPPLSEQDALAVAAIYSITQQRPTHDFFMPPFRAPHHTASAVALVGGSARPRPGEISLAHAGILFLDELPEFDRKVLEVLREPMESGVVHISRAAQQTSFPARFQLVAAMNPCPCGYLNDPRRGCGYFCEKAKRYQSKLSGPLLDRIDMQLEVSAVKTDELLQQPLGETSAVVRARVCRARTRQLERQGKLNAQLTGREIAPIIAEHEAWLAQVMERLNLSARALHRTLRVARTLADMTQADRVEQTHLLEAMGFRLTSGIGQ